MKDKITLLETGKKNELFAAIEELKRNLPEITKQVLIIAEIRKANYDAHIEKGFTPEQALELCKTLAL